MKQTPIYAYERGTVADWVLTPDGDRVMVAANPQHGIVAVWHGGQYIDIHTGSSYASMPLVPYTVINVWDSEHDRPLISRGPAALRHRLAQWLRDSEEVVA